MNSQERRELVHRRGELASEIQKLDEHLQKLEDMKEAIQVRMKVLEMEEEDIADHLLEDSKRYPKFCDPPRHIDKVAHFSTRRPVK